ncbi:MAG: TIGR00153 family protein [Candidatus Methanofastidiosia archaeon]
MVRLRDRIRVPLLGTLREDPFVNLIKHANTINSCSNSLRKAVQCYFDGDFKNFEKYKKDVILQESNADNIKRNIRNHLPRNIYMPVDKRIFLLLLTQQDKILDYAEDVVQWLSMREKKYDKEIAGDFNKLMDKVSESISFFEKAIFNLPEVVEASFTDEERNETKKYIKKVSLAEYESDVLEMKLTKKIFSMEDKLSPLDIYHLTRTVHLLGEISNHAENASDKIRTLLAR